MFMIKNDKKINLEQLNEYNDMLYKRILDEGVYYLHHFPIIIKGKKYSVLRFMSGNPFLDKEDVNKLVDYLKEISNS